MIHETQCRLLAEHHRRMADEASNLTDAKRHLAIAEEWDEQARKARQLARVQVAS